MLALVAAPGKDGGVELREVAEPTPAADQAIVAVQAASINRGEVTFLARAVEGSPLGWEVAGVVAQPAADGSDPPRGARVVGRPGAAGWAQRVAVSTGWLSELPEGVSFAAASTLPTAGLTALYALKLGGLLLGKRVLVTGASGGVGHYAIQLAARAGAHVAAVVSRPERAAGLAELGAHEVLVGLESDGPSFDVILESVGGATLEAAIGRVASDGIVVVFGNSSGQPTTFDARTFFRRSGARVYAFTLLHELQGGPQACQDLAYLAGLLATGELDPGIDVEVSWRQASEAITALRDRRVAGKAVLLID